MTEITESTEDYGRPQRKYEVFLSSTYTDLIDLRKSFLDETSKLGHIASGMELFSKGGRDVDVIRNRIATADIFVILVGARYGSTVKLKPAHFIQLEYDIAVEFKKPILAYLLHEDEYQQIRGSLPNRHLEREVDHEFDLFRERVKQLPDGTGRLIGYFSLKSSPAEVLHEYAQDLLGVINDLKNKNTGGWIRAKEYDSIITVSSNRFFKRFVGELNKFDVLSARIVQNGPELKISVAKFFLDHYLGRMVEKGVKRFFFESGSSIAFLSEYFIELLHREHWLMEYASRLEIHTNNILTYIDFTLTEAVHVELFPDGPPEKKYGATFGPLTSLPRREPPRKLRELSPRASDVVNQVSKRLAFLYEKSVDQENGVIFMTASGLEVSPMSPFYGPHVGSYSNMLFKKALLSTTCPTVLFLDEKKLLNNPFDPDVCYPVCDEDLSWSLICSERPLAVALGCASENKREECAALLRGMGLSVIDRRPDDGVEWPLIASNEAFTRLW